MIRDAKKLKRRRTNDQHAGPELPLSLVKGLQLLEITAAAGEPMPLRDLAAAVGLGKASTLRLLRTLHSTGYLLRDQNENYYSGRDWPFPHQNHMLRLLRESAAPILAGLNPEFCATVSLALFFCDIHR